MGRPEGLGCPYRLSVGFKWARGPTFGAFLPNVSIPAGLQRRTVFQGQRLSILLTGSLRGCNLWKGSLPASLFSASPSASIVPRDAFSGLSSPVPQRPPDSLDFFRPHLATLVERFSETRQSRANSRFVPNWRLRKRSLEKRLPKSNAANEFRDIFRSPAAQPPKSFHHGRRSRWSASSAVSWSFSLSARSSRSR